MAGVGERSGEAARVSEVLRSLLAELDEEEAALLSRSAENAAVPTQQARGQAADSLARERDLEAISVDVRTLARDGGLADVEQELLVAFVRLLDRFGVVRRQEGDTKTALDLGKAIAEVLAADEHLDQKVISGEVLENLVGLCRSVIYNDVCACLDEGFLHKIGERAVVEEDEDENEGKDQSTSSSKRKRQRMERKTASKKLKMKQKLKDDRQKKKRKPSSCDDEDYEYDEEDENLFSQDESLVDEEDEEEVQGAPVTAKKGKTNRSSASFFARSVSRLLLDLERIVRKVPNLEENLLMSISSFCLASFVVDAGRGAFPSYMLQLQQASMDLLRTLFRWNPDFQDYVINELVDNISRLPSSKSSSLRTLKVSDDAAPVQGVTVLLLELVQASCVSSRIFMDVDEGSGVADPEPQFEKAANTGKGFLQKLLDKCAFPKSFVDGDDLKQSRLFLTHLVEDLLELVYSPRWPAAELLLRYIANFLSKHLLGPLAHVEGKGKNSQNSSRFGVQALTLLGHIVARVQVDRKWVEENHLKLPMDIGKLERAKKPKICPICEFGDVIGNEVDDFSLECSNCSQLFHKECLNADISIKSFCCADCVMGKHLAEISIILQSNAASKENVFEADEDSGFRQLYLNELMQAQQSGSSQAQFAMEFCVARWLKSMHGTHSQSERLLKLQWSKQGELLEWIRTKHSTRARNSLSRSYSVAIIKHLASTSKDGLCATKNVDKLLVKLFKIVTTGQATFRARAIKALGVIVSANPDMLLDSRFRTVVENRVHDEAVSVREATLDLVGRYLLAKPELILCYQPILEDRLNDKGVSVRKRVVKVFRLLLLSRAKFENRTRIHAALLQRILDPNEEESIRDVVISIFRDLWFRDPSSLSASELGGKATPAKPDVDFVCDTPVKGNFPSDHTDPGSDGMQPKTASLKRGHFKTPMQAIHSVSSQKKGGKSLGRMPSLQRIPSLCDISGSFAFDEKEDMRRSAHDIMKLAGAQHDNEWFVTLLTEVFHPDNEKLKQFAPEAQERSKSIVKALVKELMEVQDEDFEIAQVSDDYMIENATDVESTTVQLICTLEIFCDGSPSLLIPHIETLAPYLKRDMLQLREENEAHVSCMLLRILTKVLRLELTRLDSRFFTDLLNDLSKIIFMSKPEVVVAAISCLGACERHSDHVEKRSTVILDQFLKCLRGLSRKTLPPGSVNPIHISNAQRALLGCGTICRDCTSVTNESIREIFQHVLFHGSESQQKQIRVVSIQALGMIWTRDAGLTLNEKAHNLVTKALTQDEAPQVRTQMLNTLRSLLEAEEERLSLRKKGEEDAEAEEDEDEEVEHSRAERIIGEADMDSGLIASTMQRHSDGVVSLLFHGSPKVRVSAVLLMGIMLRQGLMNPFRCIEPMVTLECEENWIVHDTAHRFLVDLDDRSPGFLVHNALRGMMRACTYRKKNGLAKSAAVPKDSEVSTSLRPTFSIFSRLYKSCIAKTSALRNQFLQNAISLFKPDLSVFKENLSEQRHNAANAVAIPTSQDFGSIPGSPTSSRWRGNEQAFEVLHFVAETLATLPYTLWEEPLYIIYQINRLTSLHGEEISRLLKPTFKKKTILEDGAEPPHQRLDDAVGPEIGFSRLVALCKESFSLLLLLELKEFLRKTYDITDAKCENFNPNEHEKLGEKQFSKILQELPEFEPLKHEAAEVLSKGSKGLYTPEEFVQAYRPVYKIFRAKLASDPDDIKHVAESSKKTRRKKGNEA